MANQSRDLKSFQEILNACFDTSDNMICVTTSPTTTSTSLLSVQEILNRAFDSVNNRLNTK